MGRPAPLAVGLVRFDPEATTRERSQERIRFRVWALDEGYALVETFEVAASPVTDEATLVAMHDLVERCAIPTLIVMDDVPQQALARARLDDRVEVVPVAAEVVDLHRGRGGRAVRTS